MYTLQHKGWIDKFINLIESLYRASIPDYPRGFNHKQIVLLLEVNDILAVHGLGLSLRP